MLIYKATRVVNIAIGEMLMIGAYLFFAFAAGMGLPIWLAIPARAAGIGGIRRAGRAHDDPADARRIADLVLHGDGRTVGSILVGLVELIWTADQQRLPEFLPTKPIAIGEAFVSPKIFYGFWIAVLLIVAVLLVFRFWRGGVALRATASDQAAAYSMGINVPRVFSLAWMAAAMIAGVAGIVVGSIGGISSAMGVFGLSVLVVVIFGGLDSVLGALVGGLFVGLVEALRRLLRSAASTSCSPPSSCWC